MNKTIIAFGGKAGCGKDTAADYLVRTHGYTRLALADQLKQIARYHFGWDGKKDKRGRRLLQVLGAEAGREYNEDFWIDKFFSSAEFNTLNKIVIPDCRFLNEVKKIRKCGGVVIQIYGRGGLPGAQASHVSETELADYKDWDFSIYNDGPLSKLHLALDGLISEVKEQSD